MSSESGDPGCPAIVNRTVKIDVFKDKDGDFYHEWLRDDGVSGDGVSPIELPRRTGPWLMQFNLQEPGLRFKHPAEEAMWVRRGTSHCPTGPGNGNQISFQSRTDDVLIILNKNNGNPVNLRYMLRFDPDEEWDPIIKNGV